MRNHLLLHSLLSSAVQKDAYEYPFHGDAANRFIDYILGARDTVEKSYRKPANSDQNQVELYAQTVSIVQSSGTGKSRMMTEVCAK